MRRSCRWNSATFGSRRRAWMRARIASGLAGPAESARAMTALSAALIASSSLAPLTPIGVDGLSLRPSIQIQTPCRLPLQYSFLSVCFGAILHRRHRGEPTSHPHLPPPHTPHINPPRPVRLPPQHSTPSPSVRGPALSQCEWQEMALSAVQYPGVVGSAISRRCWRWRTAFGLRSRACESVSPFACACSTRIHSIETD